MLLELAIRNFAIIRDLRVGFGPGLNAMTGETGAGKSIIIDALGAVLGSRISSDLVRTDEQHAWVEAVFDLQDVTQREQIAAALSELGIELDENVLILTRDIRDSGRSTARINGRTVPARVLSTIGQFLVDIHGQSDHLSLLRPAEHLPMLDQYAGTTALQRELAAKVTSYRAARDEIERIRSTERERAQRLDLLRFQVEEIDAAGLSPGDDDALYRERQVLSNAERLREIAREAYMHLEGDDSLSGGDSSGALDALRKTSDLLDELAEVDAEGAGEIASQVRDALFLLQEWAPAVRTYAEEIEADPERLEAVEERITLLKGLQRKYGAAIDDILAYRDAAQAELTELESSDERVDHLLADLESKRAAIGELAERLSSTRRRAAAELEARVEGAIADLHMGGAVFRVGFSELSGNDTVTIMRDGASVDVAFDASGIDRVEFLIAPNAGEVPRSLARIASGGETARLMLALKSILSDVDATPTLIFDEIDVGVGGRSGQPVGEKLWGLSRGHQVIVISHLPQIAAFADTHLKISKRESNGRTETEIRPLGADERVEEIAAMLDGVPVTTASRANAEDMLQRIEEWKSTHVGTT